MVEDIEFWNVAFLGDNLSERPFRFALLYGLLENEFY